MYTVAFFVGMLPQAIGTLPLTLKESPEPEVVTVLPSSVVNVPCGNCALVIFLCSTTW